MRLKPPVSVEEALSWLETQAIGAWGVEAGPELTTALTSMAQAMAAVSAAAIPEDIEPLLV